MRVSLLFIALASCGDNRAPRVDEPRSGTRLGLVRDIYEDGSEAIANDRFYDRELATECRPTRWSDGRVYCTPEAGRTVFGDPGCQWLVGQVPQEENGFPPEPPRFFVRQFRIRDQQQPSSLYVPGIGVPEPRWIYEQRDGVCFGPLAPGVVANYYALDEVRAVRLHEIVVTADERFALEVTESDDGLVAPTGWNDLQHRVACRPDGAPDAMDVPCVPTSAEPATVYLDAQCTTPAVFSSEDGAMHARFVDPDTRCTTYRPIEEVIDRAQIFLHLGESCDAVDVPPNTVRTLGAALALAPIAREQIDTGHRLQALVSSAGDLRIVDDERYDTALATTCRPALVEGAVRCVPTTTTEARVYFTDENCKLPTMLARVPPGRCASARFARDIDGMPRALGESYVGPVFTVVTGGACVPAESAGATFRVAGEPLVDELATVRRVRFEP